MIKNNRIGAKHVINKDNCVTVGNFYRSIRFLKSKRRNIWKKDYHGQLKFKVLHKQENNAYDIEKYKRLRDISAEMVSEKLNREQIQICFQANRDKVQTQFD